MLNSDAPVYGGSGVGNYGSVTTWPVPGHGQFQSVNLTLPPLGALFLVPVDGPGGGDPAGAGDVVDADSLDGEASGAA